jgi:cystathionine beta-lyase
MAAMTTSPKPAQRTVADPLDVLRTRTSVKWSLYPADVLPMFVAEMDFPLAPEIRAALAEAVSRSDTGYANSLASGLPEAFSAYATEVWDWAPDPSLMRTTTDVSVVIAESLRRLVRPGERVIINPPVYPPFYELVEEAGGVVEEVPLLDDGESFSLDLAGIDTALRGGARGVLLCNPHNPVGLVPSREVLIELSRIVAKHGGFTLSDEIHAPLVHAGVEFTPYLTVSEEARAHGIAAESASKAFNLAGLKSALFVTAGDAMSRLVAGLPDEVSFRTGHLGIIAARTGFTESGAWLAGTIAAVEHNLSVLESTLAEHLPAARLRRPQASYLAWLDLSGLGWGDDPAVVALERAKVALHHGPAFGAPGTGHARMNIACAPDTITEAVMRLARAAA